VCHRSPEVTEAAYGEDAWRWRNQPRPATPLVDAYSSGVGDVVSGGTSLVFETYVVGRAVSAFRSKTTLYRAVSPEEYEQIIRTGRFESAGSVEGKYFAESFEDANTWGTRLYGEGNYEVVQVELSKNAANAFYRWERLDMIGPARFATMEQLDSLPMIIKGVK